MNRDDTARLLRTRSALTSQPHGDEAIEAWYAVLGAFPFDVCYRALLSAARETTRVTVSHVVEHMPSTDRRPEEIPEDCELCDGSGWETVEGEAVHDRRYCRATEPEDCHCSGVVPCRCTTGQRRRDVHQRIIDSNARERARLRRQP